MDLILKDIQLALEARAYYAALAAAVTVPEVCMRCEQEDPFSRTGKSSGENVYRRFVEDYLPDWHLGLTGEDLYAIRCGLSHRARLDQKKRPLRYIFHPPNEVKCIAYGNRRIHSDGSEVLDIDLETFCNDLARAVQEWHKAKGDEPVVQANLEHVLQVRPAGFGTGVRIEGSWVLG